MLLAGVALAMAAEGRARVVGPARAAASVHARGWQVFGLAFLFRLQAQLLGWGPLINLLKVDILNVMGIAMIVSAWIWRLAPTRFARMALYAGATAAFTMLTPLVRESSWVGWLPDPIEWYLRPAPNRTTFALFPWAGFLTAGAFAGEWLDAGRPAPAERRVQWGFASLACACVAAGYAASLLPSIYETAQFWTSSPTFFLIRLGLCLAFIPAAWLVPLTWEPLVTLGRSSLFVYWIHVEMVYGAAAIPLRRSMPWEMSVTAAVLLCVLLYGLVRLKNRMMEARSLPPRYRLLAPILK
jgi:uncharacterized membrane protein